MSRTQGVLAADTGWGDGQIFIGPGDFEATSGTFTATRNASGDVSLNAGASNTGVLIASLSKVLFRYGSQDWLQEQFGGGLLNGAQGLPVGGYTTQSTASASAGSNVSVAVLSSANFTIGRTVTFGTAANTTIVAKADSTHITLANISATQGSGTWIQENIFTTPAGLTGPPPFTGTSEFTPVTSPRPKGIFIREIYPVYLISGAAATTNTIGLTKTVFANATAVSVSSLLTNAANGLATATQATPYVTPIQVPSPAWQTTKFAEYLLEWDISTTTGGAARIYGCFVDVGLNFN